MKSWLTFLAIIICFFAAAQRSLPLNFQSYAINLSVAKDESLVIVNRVGEVGLAASIESPWMKSELKDGRDSYGPTLDNANFFNKDTGFVSGYIYGKSGETDIIFHTINGGKSWKQIDFGKGGWVDDAINLDNGTAWMSVSGRGILFSSDFGITWTDLKSPDNSQRFSVIFFNSSMEGIIGSLYNKIAITGNNCETWQIIPTPLDQKKYTKIAKDQRPEISKVAIYGDYYLVKEEDLVFYSKKNSIDWIWLKDYTNFYTDPYNSALFFENKKSQIFRMQNPDSALNHFNEISTGFSAKCKNGSLFTIANEQLTQIQPDDHVVKIYIKPVEEKDIEPETLGYTGDSIYGIRGNDIYVCSERKKKWVKRFSVPYSLEKGKLTFLYKEILYDNNGDSLFYFDLSGHLKKQVSKKEMFESFAKAGIRTIVFDQGSRGCFHYYSDKLTYSRAGDIFGNAIEESHDSKGKGMPESLDSFPADTVISFMGQLQQIFSPDHLTTIADLRFTDDDYEQCKKDILRFQRSVEKQKKETDGFYFPKNNLDFARLISLVDSIKNIDSKTLTNYLRQLSTIWSTTTMWKTVSFINYDGDVLNLGSYFYEPNFFCFPWSVSLNGYSVYTTNISINRLIGFIYPKFLENEKKIEILYRLVKMLY